MLPFASRNSFLFGSCVSRLMLSGIITGACRLFSCVLSCVDVSLSLLLAFLVLPLRCSSVPCVPPKTLSHIHLSSSPIPSLCLSHHYVSYITPPSTFLSSPLLISYITHTLPLYLKSTLTTFSPPEMSHLSTSLRTESEKYRRAAKNINFHAMLRQYAPLGGVALIVIFFLWWRFW